MDLVFQSHPDVIIGSNTFRNVPTILQYADTPLIEVGKFEPAGYTTKFAVYHNDGTRVAIVKGSQIHLTPEGEKSSVRLRHEPNLTVCEFEGKPIYELRRDGAAALKGWAELYAPEGVLIKANSAETSAMLRTGDPLAIDGMTLKNCEFINTAIGILVTREEIRLGVGSLPEGGRSLKYHVDGLSSVTIHGHSGNWSLNPKSGGRSINIGGGAGDTTIGPGSNIKAGDGHSAPPDPPNA